MQFPHCSLYSFRQPNQMNGFTYFFTYQDYEIWGMGPELMVSCNFYTNKTLRPLLFCSSCRSTTFSQNWLASGWSQGCSWMAESFSLSIITLFLQLLSNRFLWIDLTKFSDSGIICQWCVSSSQCLTGGRLCQILALLSFARWCHY